MNEKALRMWYDALRCELGGFVMTDDPHWCKQALYAARSEASDPRLEGLSLMTSPRDPDNEVWIVRNRDGET